MLLRLLIYSEVETRQWTHIQASHCDVPIYLQWSSLRGQKFDIVLYNKKLEADVHSVFVKLGFYILA